ncbi:hypothetical protein [Mesorhizobium sp. 1B3]|uniref:hypothetical protein n=1 Tax=Mesorhizobium sp. 1B3 TaxID=3243599 RepID=UPI003D95598B
MKRKYLLALLLVPVSADAYAISRYNSQGMTCGRVHAAIRNEGAVILRYSSKSNPSLPLYDRYVLHDGFCSYGEYAKYASVPTRDTPSCPVYKCEQRTYDDDFFRRFD